MEPITRSEMLMDGQYVEPITRKEKILSGDDLEPVTREEYFLKKYRHSGGDVDVVQLTATTNKVYTAPEGKAYNPVLVDVALPQNAYLLESQSGDVVTFQNGAVFDMPKLIASIEPQQDLHGYENPWVGGSGKNKLNPDKVTKTSATMWKWYVSDGFLLKANTKYTLSNFTPNTNIQMYIMDSTGSTVLSSSNNLTSYTPTEDTTVIFQAYKSDNIPDSAIFQLEIGDKTTYEPYSNICPISGWDECKVTVADDIATVENVYAIDLDGTRYGGTLDVVSGVLTVDRAIKKIGEMNWTYWQGNTFYTESVYSTKGYVSTDDLTCSCYGDGSTSTTGVFSLGGNDIQKKYIYLTDSSYSHDASGASEIKSSLANEEIVYYLATPQTIQLTPTEVKSLLGVNNIFADTGEVDVQIWTKEV